MKKALSVFLITVLACMPICVFASDNNTAQSVIYTPHLTGDSMGDNLGDDDIIFDDTNREPLGKGDVNEDGKINNKDLGRLIQYINTWPVDINIDYADVTGDGKVNNKDVGILMQYINKWDVELK